MNFKYSTFDLLVKFILDSFYMYIITMKYNRNNKFINTNFDSSIIDVLL